MLAPIDPQEVYKKRINRVIDFISTHLAEPLNLNTLAEIASFSPYHFHRIFTALVGETPAEYVLRLRLEWAANLLLKSPQPITRIAMQSGFSTPAVFTRAFRHHFGLPPRIFRYQAENRLPARPSPPHPQTSLDFVLDPVRVQTLLPLSVIYVASYAGYNLEKICIAWNRLHKWAVLHNLLNAHTRAIGISFDDPRITVHNRCRYYACFTVSTKMDTAQRIGSLEIPGGPYAIFQALCRAEDIQPLYFTIYNQWLPESGYQPGSSFPYEIYLQTPETHPHGLYEMQVCIPVEPIQ